MFCKKIDKETRIITKKFFKTAQRNLERGTEKVHRYIFSEISGIGQNLDRSDRTRGRIRDDICWYRTKIEE